MGMNRYKTASMVMILLLIVFSGIISTVLIFQGNAWPLIVGYWIILTVKNVMDLWAVLPEEGEADESETGK